MSSFDHSEAMKRQVKIGSRDRRRGPRAPRVRRTPRLEPLEERTLLSVWTVTDNSDNPTDTGSLRYAINNAPSGTTIEFAKSVKSITLINGELEITTSLDIAGPGSTKLTISGGDPSRVFDVLSGVRDHRGNDDQRGRGQPQFPEHRQRGRRCREFRHPDPFQRCPHRQRSPRRPQRQPIGH